MTTGAFKTLPIRVAVAAVAIPIITWLSMRGGYWFFGFVALISEISLYEFYQLSERKGASPQNLLGLVAGLLISATFMYERLQVEIYSFFSERGVHLFMFSQLQLLLVIQLVFLLVVLLVELFRRKGSPFQNLGATVLGVFTLPLFFGTLIMVRELFPYGFPVHKFFSTAFASDDQLDIIDRWGGYTIISLLACIWICDTAAYFAGVKLGKHKLLERVSPNKTWEGAAFGFVFAILSMLAARFLVLDYLTTWDAVVLGSFVGVFGQLGDLIESRFKRDADVKDSSAIIPGHGGVYDRFDSLVFVAPFVYLYIDFVVLS